MLVSFISAVPRWELPGLFLDVSCPLSLESAEAKLKGLLGRSGSVPRLLSLTGSSVCSFHNDAPKDYRQVSLTAVKQRFEDKRYEEISQEEVGWRHLGAGWGRAFPGASRSLTLLPLRC